MDHETSMRIAQAEANRKQQEAEVSLWIPGFGDMTRKQRQVQLLIDSYGDGRFMLAKHNVTNDWVVFLKRNPITGEPYPVLGLGQELPEPDEVMKLMVKYDLRINGERIFEEMRAHNEALERQQQEEWEATKARTAEAYIHFGKKEGMVTKPTFIPRDIPKGEE